MNPSSALTDVVAKSGATDNVLTTATVLIADDQSPNLLLLERILSTAGVPNVHVTTDPTVVIELVARHRPDIVLLDLHMPGMDGIAVIDAIRATSPDDDFLPVVVITADATLAARDRALAAGANDFLTKPVDRAEVVLRTRNLLETRGLHRRVQEHNRVLRLEIEERTAAERRLAAERADIERRIRRVLTTDGVRIAVQPIMHLETRTSIGFEALSRFDQTPSWPPNIWFDQAARVGLGVELELAAVHAALQYLERVPPDAYLAVNVSPTTAMSDALAELLRSHPSQRIVLEITEHAAVDDYDALTACLQRIGRDRVRLAVDDAGAGFASLHHILRLQPDIIKLDISLVRGLDNDPIKRSLASSLVTFGHEIGATIIAEGIETADELKTLVDLGVTFGQGYHIGRPTEPDRVLKGSR